MRVDECVRLRVLMAEVDRLRAAHADMPPEIKARLDSLYADALLLRNPPQAD